VEFRLIPIKIVNLFKGTNGLKKMAGSRNPDNLSDIWRIVTFKLPLPVVIDKWKKSAR
jgi:hypothetical protein